MKKKILSISRFFATHEARLREKLIEALLQLKNALAQESTETRQMLTTYVKYSSGEVSKADMKKANEQFRDLIRALGIGIFAFLPLAPITIPFIVKIGKRLGVDILPSAFRKKE